MLVCVIQRPCVFKQSWFLQRVVGRQRRSTPVSASQVLIFIIVGGEKKEEDEKKRLFEARDSIGERVVGVGDSDSSTIFFFIVIKY